MLFNCLRNLLMEQVNRGAMFFKFSVLCFLLSFVINLIDCTRCRPYSRFTVDCNSCMCLANGMDYICGNEKCKKVPNYDNFIKVFDKDGRVILKPKLDGELANKLK